MARLYSFKYLILCSDPEDRQNIEGSIRDEEISHVWYCFSDIPILEALFHEELGLILEVRETDVMYVIEEYILAGVPCQKIGHSVRSTGDAMVSPGNIQNEPLCEKTSLRGFQPGPTQTRLCSHIIWLEA